MSFPDPFGMFMRQMTQTKSETFYTRYNLWALPVYEIVFRKSKMYFQGLFTYVALETLHLLNNFHHALQLNFYTH